MTDHLPDANVSIGPMTFCNYCQQNVGGAIKHKADCKTLTDAETLAMMCQRPERYGIINRTVVLTEPIVINQSDAERLEALAKEIEEWDVGIGVPPQFKEAANALRELKALQERCEKSAGVTFFNATYQPAMVFAVRELLGSLPASRDWFNPDAERVFKEFLSDAKAHGQDSSSSAPAKQWDCACGEPTCPYCSCTKA